MHLEPRPAGSLDVQVGQGREQAGAGAVGQRHGQDARPDIRGDDHAWAAAVDRERGMSVDDHVLDSERVAAHTAMVADEGDAPGMPGAS